MHICMEMHFNALLIVIDRVMLAKQGDNKIGSARPFVLSTENKEQYVIASLRCLSVCQ